MVHVTGETTVTAEVLVLPIVSLARTTTPAAGDAGAAYTPVLELMLPAPAAMSHVYGGIPPEPAKVYWELVVTVAAGGTTEKGL
jgi:hypothetical protein